MDALKAASSKLTVLLLLDSWAQLRSSQLPVGVYLAVGLAQNLGRVTSTNETDSLVVSLVKVKRSESPASPNGSAEYR
jgi:hypothetical protein